MDHLIAELEKLGKEDVHREWRDGMLAQGRKVSTERMEWETLSDEDHQLDDRIAAALSAPSGDGLRGYVEHKAGCEKAERPGNNFSCTCGLDAALAASGPDVLPPAPAEKRLWQCADGHSIDHNGVCWCGKLANGGKR